MKYNAVCFRTDGDKVRLAFTQNVKARVQTLKYHGLSHTEFYSAAQPTEEKELVQEYIKTLTDTDQIAIAQAFIDGPVVVVKAPKAAKAPKAPKAAKTPKAKKVKISTAPAAEVPVVIDEAAASIADAAAAMAAAIDSAQAAQV